MAGTTYFLLTFDRRRQRLLSKQAFTSEKQASEAYAALEARNRNKGDYEVVLVGADSEDTLHHTHGHYFGRRSQSAYLKPVLLG